jgi:hypothetical protein
MALRLIRKVSHLTINSIKLGDETNYVGRRLCCAQGHLADRGLSVLYGRLVSLTTASARKITLGFHPAEVCARVVGHYRGCIKGHISERLLNQRIVMFYGP